MKMHRYIRKEKKSGSKEFQISLLLLCVFFVVGAGLGRLGHSYVTASNNAELSQYICGYAELVSGSKNAAANIYSVLLLYFRYPLVYFLLGFTSVGIAAIPFLSAVQGFFLSFSISCFASSLGKSGVLLAFSAFGIRSLVTLPCCFLLAAWSFLAAKNRGMPSALPAVKGGKRSARFPPEYFWRFLICVVVLLVGCVLELSVVPRLFALALTKI